MASVTRRTGETCIELTLVVDGTGQMDGSTDIGFFDHMLNALAKHAGFDVKLSCEGDLQIDDHHTVEDIGICLGQAFAAAMADKEGIQRFGNCYAPLDEALARAVVDISGRSYLAFDAPFSRSEIGTFSTEMVQEFFRAFTDNARITLHLTLLSGTNAHHQVEAVFKAAARALRQAAAVDPGRMGVIPSTKGVL